MRVMRVTASEWIRKETQVPDRKQLQAAAERPEPKRQWQYRLQAGMDRAESRPYQHGWYRGIAAPGPCFGILFSEKTRRRPAALHKSMIVPVVRKTDCRDF